MGALDWPTSGTVYLDANGFIYSIERIDPYRALLDTLATALLHGCKLFVTNDSTFRRLARLPVTLLSEIAL